jgi:oligosaccharide repeat unit polymerase
MIFGVTLILLGFSIAGISMVRKCFFSPFSCYVFAHLIVAGFCLLGCFNEKPNFDSDFFLIIAVMHTSFLLGVTSAMKFIPASSQIRTSQLPPFEIKLSLIMPVLGIIAVLILIAKSGSIPLFSHFPEKARVHLVQGRINGICFAFSIFSSLIAVRAFVLYGKWSIALLALLLLILITLTGNRAYVILALVYGIAAQEVIKKKAIAVSSILLGIFLLLFFFGVSYLRDTRFQSGGALGESAKFLLNMHLGYDYLCNGYWNLAVGLNKYLLGRQPFTWGTSSFSGILFWFSDVFDIQQSFHWDTLFNESVLRFAGLNSACYFWPLIKDFGFIGAGFFVYVFGAITGFCYRNVGNQTFSSYVYPFLAHQLIFSFNTFWLNEGYMSMVFILLIFAAITVTWNQDYGEPTLGAHKVIAIN